MSLLQGVTSVMYEILVLSKPNPFSLVGFPQVETQNIANR